MTISLPVNNLTVVPDNQHRPWDSLRNSLLNHSIDSRECPYGDSRPRLPIRAQPGRLATSILA